MTRKRKPAELPIIRGTNMMSGNGWELIKRGRACNVLFKGTLLLTLNISETKRLAIFSVPKRRGET